MRRTMLPCDANGGIGQLSAGKKMTGRQLCRPVIQIIGSTRYNGALGQIVYLNSGIAFN
jgi:hypothetical protein